MSNDENREKNEEKAAVPVQPIIDMGSTVVKNSRGTVHCLTIVGQVEGHRGTGSGHDEAGGDAGAGRRALHRRTAGGVRKGDIHRAHGIHDSASGADVRDGHCRAGDVQVF